VRAAWPRPSAAARWILDTLEETLEVNRLWLAGDNYGSNRRRVAFLRANFLRHWREAKESGEPPRVMMKCGATHMVRGLNSNDAFDLGSLVPHVAEAEGRAAFSLLVLGGAGSQIAQFDPSTFSYRARPRGPGGPLSPIADAAWPDAFTLFDMHPLRPIVRSSQEGWHGELVRTVHGFDAVLVMSGSTPSTAL